MNRFLSEIQGKYTELVQIVKISISFNRLVFHFFQMLAKLLYKACKDDQTKYPTNKQIHDRLKVKEVLTSTPTGMQMKEKYSEKPFFCYHPQTKIAKAMFLHVSVILSTGGMSRTRPRVEVGVSSQGGCPGPHLGGVQPHTQWGSGPGPGGCIPACIEVDPPPSRWLLLRAVRILLECILVFIC